MPGGKPGRKTVLNNARRVMINLEANQLAWIDEMIAITGLSQSEIVRIAIDRSIRIQREFPEMGLPLKADR